MKQLNIIASAGALLLVSVQVQAGDVISSVVSTITEFKVVNSAEASARVTARKDLSAGSVPKAFKLADWTASVSAGTVAYRVNRSINPAVSGASTYEWYGVASNSVDPSKKLNFAVPYSSGSQSLDGWRVLAQGVASYSGIIEVVNSSQVLLAGRYPIAIDVAAYAF